MTPADAYIILTSASSSDWKTWLCSTPQSGICGDFVKKFEPSEVPLPFLNHFRT
jgi:hypothetical protein